MPIHHHALIGAPTSRGRPAVARWVFRIAGLYGIGVLTPMLFMERQVAPGAAHPVFFYAWVGVTLAWQILFLVLSTDPARYRPMMPVCVLEKVAAVVAIPWLYAVDRIDGAWLGAAAVDLAFAVLFVAAFLVTGGPSGSDGARQATEPDRHG